MSEPQPPIAELAPDGIADLAPPVSEPAEPAEAAATGTPAAAEPLASQLKRWAKLLSTFFTTQVLTQLLGLAAGLVLVRTMPVHEFALYTLALSVITFFTFASDLGSTTSLLYFFHRSAHDEAEFARYFAAVRSLRRWAFGLGALAVAVALPRMAAAKGFAAGEIVLATAGVVLNVWFQIGSSLSVLALRLADRYGESYIAEMAGGGVRLLSAALLVWTAHLLSWLAVLGNALAAGAVVALARPPAARTATSITSAATLAPYRRQVVRYLMPTLPASAYFSIQGPLVVWLAATFGSARNIAEIGALSRLGMVLSLFSNLSTVVLLPRLARIRDEAHYRRRCLQFGALLVAISLALWLGVRLFPHTLLAVLGQHYSGLDSELQLVVTGAGITLVGGYLVGVTMARSWTRWTALAVVVLAGTQALLVALLPLGTTRGVLVFNVLSTLTGAVLQLIIIAIGLVRPRVVAWE